MWIDRDPFREKVAGCWIGKNVGGTLGQPFEGVNGVLDVEFYTQDLHGEPVPNDDLDLQLAWLVAAERHGPTVVAAILGEYWLSYITPNWSEYGFCKNNLRAGLVPPVSGSVANPHRNSNGAWIRTEIWACLNPGQPGRAAHYACEDAMVDHSAEGVYSTAFIAALQSAAFASNDRDELIATALSYIPTDTDVARAVQVVLDAHHSGASWKECRRKLFLEVPHGFGSKTGGEMNVDLPFGTDKNDAPAHIGIILLAWLYGEDDFGKSICMAVNCGADTDCTAATLGALLGIIRGAEGIPARWTEPIGDSIKTICLAGDLFTRFPQTVSELTDRVIVLAPRFARLSDLDVNGALPGYRLQMRDADDLSNREPERSYLRPEPEYNELHFVHRPFAVRYETPIYYLWFDYQDKPFLSVGGERTVSLHFHNRLEFPQWLQLRWIVPDGWEVLQGQTNRLMLEHHFGAGRADAAFTLRRDESATTADDLYLDITSEGRPTRLVVPVTFGTASAQ